MWNESYPWNLDDLFFRKLGSCIGHWKEIAKAGDKDVKSIAYWCLRWRTELSDRRHQELGRQETKYRLPESYSKKDPPTVSFSVTHIYVDAYCSPDHPSSTLHNHQMGNVKNSALLQDSFFEAVPWDKLYFQKETMIYNGEL